MDKDKPKNGHCSDTEHGMHRRKFLEGLAGGSAISMMSWAGLFTPQVFADMAKRQGKHCILLWLCGAPSQFETWDPKPNTASGGPFGSIRTTLPGIHFSELMPRCATIADRMSIVRSMKTSQSEHFQGIDLLNRGDSPRPPFTRPALGSVLAQQLGHLDSPIPNFILLDPCPEGNEFKSFKAGNWAGWLGAEYGPVRLGGDYKIPNVNKIADITSDDHEEREAFRKFLTRKYQNDTQSEAAGSYNAAFKRVNGLMSCADLFDLEKLPASDRERYGAGTFGQHVLLSRHLVENGAPFVMVANGMPWDCHVFHHENYQMLVPDLDNIIYQLVTDLEVRGLLDDTLVVMMGEFGRTPWLNASRGRDHYPNAWSLAMAGCGVQKGVVIGETDREGIEVISNPYDEKNLFATIFSALGLDPYKEYDLPGLPTFYRVEEKAEPIHQILQTSTIS